jgi:hypothetical protein
MIMALGYPNIPQPAFPMAGRGLRPSLADLLYPLRQSKSTKKQKGRP